jgi:chromosome segregation ATPase
LKSKEEELTNTQRQMQDKIDQLEEENKRQAAKIEQLNVPEINYEKFNEIYADSMSSSINSDINFAM